LNPAVSTVDKSYWARLSSETCWSKNSSTGFIAVESNHPSLASLGGLMRRSYGFSPELNRCNQQHSVFPLLVGGERSIGGQEVII